MHDQGVTWADVEAAKTELERGRLPLLSEQWKTLSKVAIPDLKRVDSEPDDHPLRVLFRFLVHGRYPPPEFLVAMQHAFQAYLDARGQMTLEEAFFGAPHQRAGTYAQRNAKAERDFRGALSNPPGHSASDPEQRAEGMPITRKALARIVRKNQRLRRLTETDPPDKGPTGPTSRRKSSAK